MSQALASAAVLLLAACVPPRPGAGPGLGPQHAPTPPVPAEPPAPRGPCPPGVALIGRLVVERDIVSVNGHQAHTGQTICEGDDVETSSTGTGDVIVSGDNDSDSIHLAEGTDPRMRWTRSRCISIDGFTRGTINLTTRNHCMLLRTRDVLIYHPPASLAQYVVNPSNATQVKPYRGQVPVALQSINENELHNLPVTQLLERRAPPALQPHEGSLNVYRGNALAQPPRKLTPEELRLMEMTTMHAPKIEQPIKSPP